MYEGPVIYESKVPDYFLIALLITIFVMFLLFLCYSLFIIFKKADQKPFLAFIPFVNIFTLLKIANLSYGYFLLSLIPIVQIYALYKLSRGISAVFKRNSKFTWGLLFLPFVFYPILAFSNSRYVGINEEKVEEVVIKDLIVEKQVITDTQPTILKTDQNVNVGTSTATVMNKQDNVLKADESILNKQVSTQIEYVECPNCKNKVKKGAGVCFICGHKI